MTSTAELAVEVTPTRHPRKLLGRPDLIAALVAAGMDVDTPRPRRPTPTPSPSTQLADIAIRAVRQLQAIGLLRHTDVKRFALLGRLIRSPHYSTVDSIRARRGLTTSWAALVPQLATTDLVRHLPRLDVPLVMAQGRHDQVSPGEAAQRFHDSLAAPAKRLVRFEASAHTPHLEEPAKFRDVLMHVRASPFTAT